MIGGKVEVEGDRQVIVMKYFICTYKTRIMKPVKIGL
jgi:hypothetical protein